jgi:hypothetical protein
MRFTLGTVIALASVVLASCGGGGGGGSQPPPPNSQTGPPTFGTTSFSATEDTDLSGRAPATDPNGDTISFARTSDPTRGTVVSVNTATGEFVYRPNPNANGADSFGLRASDTAGNATNATVSITIAAVNDPPSASVAALSTNDDTPVTSRVVATDIDGDAVIVALARAPDNGTLSPFTQDGTFTYDPARQFAGQDSFDVRVTDAANESIVLTVPITVNPTTGAIYTGSHSQVVITEPTAAPVAKGLWDQFMRLVAVHEGSVTRPLPALPAVLNLDVAGALTGTAHIRGNLDATGLGSLRITYTNFSDSQATLNGSEILDVLVAAPSRIRRTYKNVAVKVGTTEFTVNGSLVREASGQVAGYSLRGDVVIVPQNGAAWWIRGADLFAQPNFLLQRLIGSISVNQWSGTARIYDPVRGYSEFAAEGGFNFKRDTSNHSVLAQPVGRGSLTATGAAQAKVWLSSLSPATFAVELDLAARGRPAKALPFRRVDDFAVATGSDASHLLQAATALPFDTTFAEIGVPFFPEGRFSEHRQGKYLVHQWFIDVAPPGSTAQLEMADTPRPSITVDREGEYLLRLEVTEGNTKSTDYLNLLALPAGGIPGFPSPPLFTREVPGASDLVDVNTEVTLDARKSWDVFGSAEPPDYRWTVMNALSGAVLVNAVPGSVLRFTPTVPGIYFAQFHRPDTTSVAFVSKRIYVSPAVRFSAQTRLTPSGTERPWVIDMDGDQRLDIVAAPGFLANSALTLYRRKADGRFEDGLPLPEISTANQGALWLDDLSGDGRIDVITQVGFNSDVFSVAVQLPTGHFAPAITLDNGARTCALGGLWKVVGAVDVDRDGRNDLIRSFQCSDGITRWMLVNKSSASVFAAGEELAIADAAWMWQGAAEDLDGDGDRDLVGAPFFASSLPSTVNVLKLNASGGFDPSSITLSEPYTPGTFTIRDLDADDRADIVLTRHPTIILGQNANGTFTERGKFAGYFDVFEGRNVLPIADVTGDGRLDIVLPASDPAEGQRLVVQQPDGTFETRMPYLGPQGEFIDLNGDGRPDVLTRLTFVFIMGPH